MSDTSGDAASRKPYRVLSKREAIDLLLSDARRDVEHPLAVNRASTVETPFGWVFHYNDKRYVDDHDRRYLIMGIGPVIVNKFTGEIAYFNTPTTVMEAVTTYEQTLNATRPVNAIDRDVLPFASNKLRTYLAENDVACAGCGYNLRDVTFVMCPECGRVIDAPTSPSTEAETALRCHNCGYLLHGMSGDSCPECGASDITLGDYAKRRARRDRRRVPWLIATCAAFGLLFAIGHVASLFYTPKSVPGWRARLGVVTALTLVMCLAPVALAGFAYMRPSLLDAEEPRSGAMRKTIAGGCAVALVVAALLMYIF